MFICKSCRLNGEAEFSGGTVPAGEVTTGLSACGYEIAMTKLPKVIAVDQTYQAGFCPNCALGKGTMFPELVSEY